MERSFVFPSVFEENYQELKKVANNFMEGIKITDFKGNDYIVGDLALKEGNAPHKFLNSSPEDLDYQLLGLTGLLIASQGTYANLVVTTGFPFTTYLPFKQSAIDFFTGRHDINYDARTLGNSNIENVKFNVVHVDAISEIEGSIKSIRNGDINEKQNFFIGSLGFGTFETALSTPNGLIHRTTSSSKGLSYAVNFMENELQKKYYLDLLTQQQIERAFQRGVIIINRKKVDLKELRKKALHSYYTEVVSPAFRKKFTDEDFLRAEKLYLVGGGAMYTELVDLFNEEFKDILEVIVVPEPYLSASKGYCINSLEQAKKLSNNIEDKSNYLFVGIDLGNSNTVITMNDNE